MNFENVVLASASPRRQELIKWIFGDFTVKVADCDESLEAGISPREAVELLARKKNAAVKELCPENALIISADTVVAVDGEILGKPVDKEDARRMLGLLSGRVHQVFTGVALALGDKIRVFSEKTDVCFYELSEEEIEEYISGDAPYDKAGAYGIQGEASLFVKELHGDYYNVVGLPVARIKRELMSFPEK